MRKTLVTFLLVALFISCLLIAPIQTQAEPATADIFLTISASPDTVNVGDKITYTITITNNGPSPATNCTISIPIPDGTTLLNFTAPSDVTFTTPPSPTSGTITATASSLAVGASKQVTMEVIVNPDFFGLVSLLVSVSSFPYDPDSLNNSASAMKMVLPADDVIITHKITDANLLSTIRSKLNKPEGDITVADMKTITDIKLSTLRYESIAELEYAVNLETLEILIISDSSPLDITPPWRPVQFKISKVIQHQRYVHGCFPHTEFNQP